MKWLMFLALVLSMGIGCRTHTSQIKEYSNSNQIQRTLASPTPAPLGNGSELSKESNEQKDVAPAFREIDFTNFAYPTSWTKKSIRLKNGRSEYKDRHGIGGETYELEGVYYADLTGDGNKDAVVQLFQLICGGSCDGGSHLFYFYSIQKRKLTLLSRIETGSLAYGCGLKSFIINKGSLALEVFSKCHRKGATLEADYGVEEFGKFSAKSFTRFLFDFRKGKLALKKREIFPFPPGDAKNYHPTISVTND